MKKSQTPVLSNHPILTDSLVEHIAGLPEDEQRSYLFLTNHDQFSGRWYVDSLHQGFMLDFEDLIGRYRTVSPAKLAEFIEFAADLEYKVLFAEDPALILKTFEHLNDPPPFKLNSDMSEFLRSKGMEREAEVVDQTGFLPFQLQGFNYLRATERAGMAVWSTGTGKTALETGLIKQHLEIEDYDLAFVVCKRNNKVDTQRKMLKMGGVDYSTILDGTPTKRDLLYGAIDEQIEAGSPQVLIFNYEKFVWDEDYLISLIEGRNLVIFWDEMPTKLSNRGTRLYQTAKRVIYKTEGFGIKWEERRPDNLRQYVLTATPIENSPLGLLNQIRMVDPTIWPLIKPWEKMYVAKRNYFSKLPEVFKNLDRMGLDIEHIVHQVDKKDPDIAKMFPAVREETIYVDWSPQDRALYDQLVDIAKELNKQAKTDPSVKPLNPLQLIGVFQMICDAPSMVQRSAENRDEFEAILEATIDEDERLELEQYVSGSVAAQMLLEKRSTPITDDHCQKLVALRDLIYKHSDCKIVIFSRLSDYIQPILEQRFKDWNVTYRTYRGTDKQRQTAKDEFRCNPDIQILLSSDIGSDSIDLPEARVTIDIDLPLTNARKIQRRNRVHRINSIFDWVIHYSLQMPNSIEDRIAEILSVKAGYHEGVFKAELGDQAISTRMTEADLWYAITGEY